MNRLSGDFRITRRNVLHEEAYNNYYNREVNENKEPTQQPEQHIEQVSPGEEMLLASFKSSMTINRNGQSIGNNEYYKDFEMDSNRLYSSHIPVRATNEHVEQVDPASFFGNSLKGIIK